MEKLTYIEKLLRQAVYEGVIELECPCGGIALCEPDGEYAYCGLCNERVVNPLPLGGYI